MHRGEGKECVSIAMLLLFLLTPLHTCVGVTIGYRSPLFHCAMSKLMDMI